MKSLKAPLAGLWLILLAIGLNAQRRRDPLSDVEVNQLRDAAQDAPTRLKLFVDFARDRGTKVAQANGDAKLKDRAGQVHDRLQDFLDVYDELNDNLDNFEKRGEDLRKPLGPVIAADSEFLVTLRAVKQSAEANPGEARQYEFLLTNTLETLQSSAQDHREMLAEQQAAAKRRKK